MIVLRELAPAKINLYLHVTDKRDDGYHLLDSLVAFADVNDKLEVIPADGITLAFEGPYANALSEVENIVMKAATALRKYFKVSAGAALTLHKNLPIGAGIGGGSADAAATLKLLTRFWKLKPLPKDLHTLAMTLGADVPACLRSQSLYMSGIGEIIEAGPPLNAIWAVLANPNKPLLTRDVFENHKAGFSTAPRHPHAFTTQDESFQFLRKTKNDLQPTAMELMDEIEEMLKALSAQEDCRIARMSGSGPTCFGLFPDQQRAEAAAQKLIEAHPKWWIKATTLR